MRSFVAAAALGAGLLPPSPARAHHPVGDSGVAAVGPQTSFALEVQVGRHDTGLPSTAADWQIITPALQVRVGEQLSLAAHLPIARVAWDDGHTETGLGDAELTGRLLIAQADAGRFALVGGLGVSLPTGSVDAQLGGGHVEASPFALIAWSRTRGSTTFVLVALAAAHLALFELGGGDPAPASARVPRHGAAPAHGAAFALHGERELMQRVTLTGAHGRWFGGGGLELVESLDLHAGPLTGCVELGVDDHGWRVSLGADTTLAGESRYDWRGRVTVARRF